MNGPRHFPLFFMLALLSISGCETLLESPASLDQSSVKSPKSQRTHTVEKTVVISDCPQNQLTHEDSLSLWLTYYFDAQKLSSDPRQKLINEQTRMLSQSPNSEEVALRLATLLSASESPENGAKALKLLKPDWQNNDFRLMADLLRKQIQDRQNQSKHLSDLQTELETSKAANTAMEGELTELRQKIKALTQIEHSIMENVEP